MKKSFYIDPVAEAQALGIIVKVDGPFSQEPMLQNGESGMIEKDENGVVTIYYNMLDHENRQRFTIAHEIGHYVLGHLDNVRKKFRDTTQNYSLSNYDIHEAEANDFAARMLMPKEKVDFLILEEDIKSITELAKLFKVSKVAMEYRLKNLGWISSAY